MISDCFQPRMTLHLISQLFAATPEQSTPGSSILSLLVGLEGTGNDDCLIINERCDSISYDGAGYFELAAYASQD